MSVQWSNGVVPGSFFGSHIFQHFAQLLDEWAAGDPGLLKYFGGESLMTKSHGESLMSFFKARYKFKGIYFLDEPETALSPKSQIELLQILTDAMKSKHLQFVIATHSPILLACPEATIYSFDHIPVKKIDYEQTDYYRVYKDFMEDRGKYIKG
jgi:predicted ATPase